MVSVRHFALRSLSAARSRCARTKRRDEDDVSSSAAPIDKSSRSSAVAARQSARAARAAAFAYASNRAQRLETRVAFRLRFAFVSVVSVVCIVSTPSAFFDGKGSFRVSSASRAAGDTSFAKKPGSRAKSRMAESALSTPGSGSGGSAASLSSSRAGRGFSSRSRTLARAAWKYASRSFLRANCHRPGGTSASGRSAVPTVPETVSASGRSRSPSRPEPETSAFAAPSPTMGAACRRETASRTAPGRAPLE